LPASMPITWELAKFMVATSHPDFRLPVSARRKVGGPSQ
jgi:hypothetical protein